MFSLVLSSYISLSLSLSIVVTLLLGSLGGGQGAECSGKSWESYESCGRNWGGKKVALSSQRGWFEIIVEIGVEGQ